MRANPLITTLAAIGAALIVIDGEPSVRTKSASGSRASMRRRLGMRNARLSAAWRFSPSTGWNNCSARALSMSGGMHTRSVRVAMAARLRACWSTARTCPAS